MKNKILTILLIASSLLSACTSKKDSQTETETGHIDITEVVSIFSTIKKDEEVELFDTNGRFSVIFGLYKFISTYEYTVSIIDYTLGESAVTSEKGLLSEDGYTLSFDNLVSDKQNGIQSLVFPYSSPFGSTFTCVDNGVVNMQINKDNEIFTLKTDKQNRQYYLDPILAGEWECVENETQLFRVNVNRVNGVDSIKYLENDTEISVSNINHDKDGTNFTINDNKSSLFEQNTTLSLRLTNSNDVINLVSSTKTYSLTKYVPPVGDEYVKGFFLYDNLKPGAKLYGTNVIFELGNSMGGDYRWVKVYENDVKITEDIWVVKNEGATLTFTYEKAGLTGAVKTGVTYLMNALKEAENTIIKLFGTDNSEMTLSLGAN